MQIGKIRKNKFDPIYNIIKEDEENLKTILNLLNSLDDIIVTPGLIVYLNVEDFKQYKVYVSEIIKSQGSDFLFDVSLYRSNLIKFIMNILTSFRTFIDIIAHRIKECYINSNEVSKYFKIWQSEMFDSKFSYRFFARFRNYVQHFGVPLDDLNINIDEFKKGNIELGIFVDKSKLMQYKEWGSIKKEINDLPEKLNIEPLILELYSCIDYIQKGMIDYFLFERKDQIDSIITLYQQTKIKGNDGQIAILEPDISKNQSTIYFVNVQIIEALIRYSQSKNEKMQ
ncbi:hypothetical protein [Leptospira sp. 'Mane']|uniref:hypothetical protein n=1 Tax=Leptospira sp. 'Mane' TaxID=3387407 RepID=UPI00398AF37B